MLTRWCAERKIQDITKVIGIHLLKTMNVFVCLLCWPKWWTDRLTMRGTLLTSISAGWSVSDQCDTVKLFTVFLIMTTSSEKGAGIWQWRYVISSFTVALVQCLFLHGAAAGNSDLPRKSSSAAALPGVNLWRLNKKKHFFQVGNVWVRSL